jgi:hypothetical protein
MDRPGEARPERRAFDVLKSAAELRLRLDYWTADRAFEDEGGRILYAVDNDVVNLFGNPKDNADYARVFDQGLDEARDVLAWVLARFIFYRLTGSNPLVMIPPHTEELEVYFGRLYQSFGKISEDVRRDHDVVVRLHKQYQNAHDMDALISGIEQEAVALVQLFYSSPAGPAAELTRIAGLLRDLRILHIERFVDEHDGWVAPVLFDDTDPADRDLLQSLTGEWVIRLDKSKSKAASASRIRRDAEVLARLERMNASVGLSRRVVLISGDHALYLAARSYEIADGESFADLYIRDPRVFLGAPGLLSTPGMSSGPCEADSRRLDLINLLDMLFACFDPRTPGYLDRLRNSVINLTLSDGDAFAEAFSRDKSDWADRLRHEWAEFVRLAAVEAEFLQDRELAAMLAKEIADLDQNALRATLERRSWEARREVVLSVIDAGFSSTAAAERALQILPARGVPALRLESFPLAKNYSDHLVRTLQQKPGPEDRPSLSELRDDERHLYTAFLVHALAFAVAGRWSATVVSAGFALEIADRLRELGEQDPARPIRGVDAAYLLAIALRHSSQRVDDLSRVRLYLEQARSRAEELPGDLRLESEKLALDITYHHYRLFLHAPIPADIPPLGQCQASLLALIVRLDTEERDETIRTALQKQVLTNLFSVLLLRRYMEGVDDPQKGTNVHLLLNRFKKVMEPKHEPHLRAVTCLTWAVYLAAWHEFGNTTEQRRRWDQAKAFVLEERHPSCYVLPYDRQRFTFLMAHMGADETLRTSAPVHRAHMPQPRGSGGREKG